MFPFFAGIGDQYGMSFMAQARLVIDEPTVLTQVVTLVNELRLEQADPDSKGDLFEHVLRQIKQAGELGQFRTPRHIIRAIVDLVDPKIGETVYDPAAGTPGFLVAAYEHIRLANSSANGREAVQFEGKTFERGVGDKLNQAQWRQPSRMDQRADRSAKAISGCETTPQIPSYSRVDGAGDDSQWAEIERLLKR